MGDPVHFMFGSRVGFSGSTDRLALFLVTSNPSWRQVAILDDFEWPYLRNGSFIVTPGGYLSAVIHSTLAGIEPTTLRLLVRRDTSRATETTQIAKLHTLENSDLQ